jgi:hypothetical protein
MEAAEPSASSAKAQCTGTGLLDVAVVCPEEELGRDQLQVAVTAFVLLFCIVGLTLWGLVFHYDYMAQQFGWTRAGEKFLAG